MSQEDNERQLGTSTRNKICPTTKEQCELLFQKMKEAGYEWDTDKKELKKIEQKSEIIFLKFRIGDKVTNGEDTYTINSIDKDCYWVNENDCATIPFEYQHHWELVEQKPAWSEEDEFRMDNLCHFLAEYGNQYYGYLTLQGTISWVKSLKAKIQSL